MDQSLEVGKVLDDRYQVTRLISEGGMASIYEAKEVATGKFVALKVPHLRYESDPNFFSRFQREEEIGATLDHPAIVRIYPRAEKSRPYLVMERLEGDLLSTVLSGDRRLPVQEAIRISIRLAEALEYMHARKVIHRDLKPENVMVCKDGSLRLLDLGLAKGEGFRRITVAGFQPEMGTPDYMSPEQVKGKGGDARSDIYSLGAMLYVMLTGAKPFRGKDAFSLMNARLVGDPVAPRRLNPEISPQLEEILLHAMARDPDARYSSVAQMKEELADPQKVILTGRCDRLVEPDPGAILWRRVRVFVWALVIVLGAMGLIYLSSRRPGPQRSVGGQK